jgi:hypothetical protein
MLRDELFRSGAPMMIALTCMLAFGYVARVRRERPASYWTVAWALLATRYAWSAFWGSPYPHEWSSLVGAMLRVSFAMTVLVGALALRGTHIQTRWIPIVAVGVPLALLPLDPRILTATLRMEIVLGTMFVLLAFAATRIATAPGLPQIERRATSLALLVYAGVSVLSTQMPNGSVAFTTTTVIAWGAQLLVAIGILATFFRLSYEAEIAARAAVENTLTRALSGFVHLCMHCKAVRDRTDQWQPLEQFIAERTASHTSHGLCETCAAKHYPEEFSTGVS